MGSGIPAVNDGVMHEITSSKDKKQLEILGIKIRRIILAI